MLSDAERVLIHGDVDGMLDATEQAALAQLIASNAEAAALSADLRHLNDLFARVPDRAPSPAFQAALAAVIPPPPRAMSAAHVVHSQSPSPRRAPSLLTLAVRRMEEVLMSRKLFLVGATAVAIIAIVAGRIIPFPPTGQEVGTIGGTEIGGVQKADRYRGRSMSEKDVSVSNPEIAVLFQNQEIISLVKSDVFREAMKSDAFRQLQASEAFRKLGANEAFRELMKSDAYAQLLRNDAYREAMANDAAREALMSDVSRKVDAMQLEREVAKIDAFREVSKMESFREIMANDAFRMVLANDAFREIMANDAFRMVLANDAFRQVMANDAFRQLQNSDAFRNVARDAQLSELFLNEAARVK